MTSTYWADVNAAHLAIQQTQPSTATRIIDLLLELDPMGRSAGDAFFSGDGGDLLDTLEEAGWHLDWIEADYFWQAHRHDAEHGRQTITFIEGDVNANKPSAPMPE